MKKIVFIIGSGRKNSFNKTLSQVAAKALEGKAEVEVVDVLDVPLLNQDKEFPAPEGVQKVRDAVMAADGVWLFTPEYNYSIPGTVKNILDWLSRPLTSDYQKKSETAIAGKVVTASGVGGRNKTAGSLGVVNSSSWPCAPSPLSRSMASRFLLLPGLRERGSQSPRFTRQSLNRQRIFSPHCKVRVCRETHAA